jgi:sugar lactone lactonase YvrE
VAADAGGKVYVADQQNHRIRLLENDVVDTVAGGTSGFSDGPAKTTAKFYNPAGVALDSAGKLYIADRSNHRIRVLENGVVSTLAGTGTAGWADGPTASAQFNNPTGVAVDATDKIYVADRSNHRIRVIESGVVKTLAGTGTAGFANGLAATAQFDSPTGIAVDAIGRVYVADYGNHRIRVIESGQVKTLAGNGAAAFADGPVATASFHWPTGVAVDSGGYVYVADYKNHRVRVIGPF